MIDWNASAQKNKMPVKELKAYLRRYPQSDKKVHAVCDGCGKVRVIGFRVSGAPCRSCVVFTEERKRNIAKACIGRPSAFKGKHHTDAAKKKLSDAGKGKQKRLGAVLSDETKRKISKGNKGNIPWSKGKSLPHTEQMRRRRSATAQGISYDEWCEFAKNKKYCPRFNEACKESNREKYGRECFICGKSEKANGQKLSVHHVDMDKAQGCESNWKLVPLCRSCHSSAHNDEIIARLGYMVKDSKTRGKSR